MPTRISLPLMRATAPRNGERDAGAQPKPSFRDAPLGAGPESIRPVIAFGDEHQHGGYGFSDVQLHIFLIPFSNSRFIRIVIAGASEAIQGDKRELDC
jgi:hypothetical protein